MKTAFASTGDYVDQHFGNARYWQIYENGKYLEQRITVGNCKGHCEGGFDGILSVLDDCDAIFAAKIGDGAAAYCISKGKRVFEAKGEIYEILRRIEDEPSLLLSGGKAE